MRTHASFRGNFPEVEDSDDPPGGPLADLIATHLSQSGFKIANRDSTEYSHTFRVRADSRSFDLMLGAVADEDRPWLLFVESSLLPFARWFGWRDQEQHQKVLKAVHECLGADSRISDLRWYTADEWNKNPAGGAPSPME